jgi:hypothetical protein
MIWASGSTDRRPSAAQGARQLRSRLRGLRNALPAPADRPGEVCAARGSSTLVRCVSAPQHRGRERRPHFLPRSIGEVADTAHAPLAARARLGRVVPLLPSAPTRPLQTFGRARPVLGPPCVRRGQAAFANLLLHVDRDWLILRLDAEHNRLRDFIGRVAPEVGNVIPTAFRSDSLAISLSMLS